MQSNSQRRNFIIIRKITKYRRYYFSTICWLQTDLPDFAFDYFGVFETSRVLEGEVALIPRRVIAQVLF